MRPPELLDNGGGAREALVRCEFAVPLLVGDPGGDGLGIALVEQIEQGPLEARSHGEDSADELVARPVGHPPGRRRTSRPSPAG